MCTTEILMKNRSILKLLIFGLSILTTSCSFAIGFDIRNASDLPITVRYSMKQSDDERFPRLVVDPDGNGGSKYSEFPEERIKRDIEKRVCEFNLLPGEEAELLFMRDREASEYGKALPIAKLYVSDGTGSLSFEGDQIFKQFRPIRKNWYTFGPEIVGFIYEYR